MITESYINSTLGWFNSNPFYAVVLLVWVMAWKGLALWKAAGLRQKYWFIALLLINTFGILEIIYYFLISRNYKVEIIEN